MTGPLESISLGWESLMNKKRIGLMLVAVLSACHRGPITEKTSSSVSPSKPLDALSDAEVGELCEWLTEDGGSYIPSTTELCTQLALRTEDDVVACRAEVERCAFSRAEDVQVTCTLAPEDLAGCEATTAEFERCARDRAAQDARYFAALTCSDASSIIAVPAPASCVALLSRCPGLARDAGDGGEPSDDPAEDPDDIYDYVDGGFVCNDGRDIEDGWQCDGTVDCFEGEDEDDCEFPPVFICRNGYSIDAGLACDQQNDCEDGSDELNCDDGYRCQDGMDIWDARVCDGNLDCTGGEDEDGCVAASDPNPEQ